MIKKIALALVLVIAGSTDVAQASSLSPTTRTFLAEKLALDNSYPDINGLFTPTASQRYFEQGRQQFQQEEQKFKDNYGFSTEKLLKSPENFDFNTPLKDRGREFLLQPKDISQ
ncbi:hypothetical protein STA3757_42760 [Stanieria sp. NIES-3757]|nr:hypothetical protein STA3757_42760 [Stanieria sp. NIES-3757]